MRRYGAETRLPPGEVLARARAFFQDRVGLQLSDESQRHIRFSGGGGWVLVTARSTFHGTDLTVEVGEFDREAEDFLASLPLPAGRLRRWWGIWRRGR